jgi:4-amino-4-deoxy-L-arabinose transferase-like glycosyltransferase
MRTRLWLLLVILGGWGLRLWRLGESSLWLDELIQVHLAGLPVRQLVPMAFKHFQVPFDILVTKSFLRLGEQDYWLRLAPALAGTLVIPLVWALARRVSTGAMAPVAAVLAALSPIALRYSREVRPYSSLLMLVTLSGYLYLRARTQPRLWPAFALGLLAAMHTHLFTLALVPVFGLHWLLADGRRRTWPAPLCLGVVTVLALLSPLTPDYIGRVGRAVLTSVTTSGPSVNEILALPKPAAGFPGLGEVLSRLLADLSGVPWAGLPTLVLILSGIYHLHRRGRRPGFLLGWLLLTPIPILVGLQAREQWYSPRYLLPMLPPLLLLSAAGIAGLGQSLTAALAQRGWIRFRPAWSVGLLLAVYLGLSAPAVVKALTMPYENLRAAAAYIAAHASPTTLVVAPLVGPYLGHYLPPGLVVHDLRDGGAVEALARDYEHLLIVDTVYSPLRPPHALWINPGNERIRLEPGVIIYRGPAGPVAAQRLRERWQRERANPQWATATPEQLRRLALTARERQAWPTAAAILERLTELTPTDANAWTDYGFALQQLRAYDEAVAAYEQALSLDPDRVWAHLFLANTRRLQGQPAAGLLHARRATELRPDLAEAWLSLALIATALADETTAWEALQQGLRVAPGHTGLLSALAGMASRASPPHADRYWQFLLEQRPPPHLVVQACNGLQNAHPLCPPAR